MGVLSVSSFYGCFLAMNLVAALFLAWVLHFVYTTVSAVYKSNTNSRGQDADEVLCACVCKRFATAFQFTMGCTVASVAFFFLGTVFAIITSILVFSMCSNCEQSDKPPFAIHIMIFVTNTCQSVGYLLMSLTHFERLRLTFSSSMLRLPKWAPNVLYAIFLLAALLVATYQVFLYIDPIVSRVCFALLILLYFSSVTAMIRAFFKKTMSIANNNELKETAVRITLSVTVSLLSSVALFFLFVVLVVVCPSCLFWWALVSAISRIDICLNAFCLLCTFRLGESHYLQVFGKPHAFFVLRVTAKEKQRKDTHLMQMKASPQSVEQKTATKTLDAATTLASTNLQTVATQSTLSADSKTPSTHSLGGTVQLV